MYLYLHSTSFILRQLTLTWLVFKDKIVCEHLPRDIERVCSVVIDDAVEMHHGEVQHGKYKHPAEKKANFINPVCYSLYNRRLNLSAFVVYWHLVSVRTFSVMYDHILLDACKLPDQTSGHMLSGLLSWWLQMVIQSDSGVCLGMNG